MCNCASDFRGKLLLPSDQLFIPEENFCHCALQEMREFLSGSKVVHRDGWNLHQRRESLQMNIFVQTLSLRNLMWEKDKAGMEYILSNANTVSTVWIGLILVGKVRMWSSRRETVVYSRPGWNRGLQHYNTRRRKSLWEFRNARNPGFWRRARELQTDGKIHWWWTERNKNFLKCFYCDNIQFSFTLALLSGRQVGQIWSHVNAQSVKSDLKRPRQFVQQC